MQECKIQNPETEKIAKYIFNLWNKEKLSIYQEKNKKGLTKTYSNKNRCENKRNNVYSSNKWKRNTK